MSRKSPSKAKQNPIALAALKRAAKEALELARRTKTPLWVMRGNQIVDATKFPSNPEKKRG